MNITVANKQNSIKHYYMQIPFAISKGTWLCHNRFMGHCQKKYKKHANFTDWLENLQIPLTVQTTEHHSDCSGLHFQTVLLIPEVPSRSSE